MLSLSLSKKVIYLGSIAVVVMLGVIGYTVYQGFSGSTSQAQARVIAEQSITKLRDPNIPAAERETVTHFGGLENLEKLLQSAKNAKDLIVLTYDEYMAQPTMKLQIGVQDPVLNTKIHGGEFLEFTDTDGSRVIIGIDQDNVPFMFQSGQTLTAASGITGHLVAPTEEVTGGKSSTVSSKATTVAP